MYRFKTLLGAPLVTIAATAALGAPALSQTMMDRLDCTRETVRFMTDSSELCDCGSITRSALTMLQRQDNFIELLQYTEAACPAFAAVLSDVPTAAIAPPPPPSDDGDNDDGSAFRGDGPVAFRADDPEPEPQQEPEPQPEPDPGDDNPPDQGDDNPPGPGANDRPDLGDDPDLEDDDDDGDDGGGSGGAGSG
jgi:hypothetical protein